MIAATAAQIAALRLDPARPILVVDADEVVVHFALPFADWLIAQDWRLHLREYRLDRAIRRESGDLADPQTTGHLILSFIDSETLHQPATPGAAECLAKLSAHASILILTNVPMHRQPDRIRNLASLGMAYPVIANAGPKGPALAALSQLTRAPLAFIDDNPAQIDSAAGHAGRIRRIQFTGCPLVRGVLPVAITAQACPGSWAELQKDFLDYINQSATSENFLK